VPTLGVAYHVQFLFRVKMYRVEPVMSRFFGLFVLCVTVILLWPAAIIIPNQSITLVISFVLSSDIDYINSLYPDAIIITAGDFNHNTSFLDVDHGLVQIIRFLSVVQTGSASPVLTATGLVNGRWQFLTPPPHRIHTT